MSVEEPEILPPEQPTLYCSECGSDVFPTAIRCASCGKDLREPEAMLATNPFARVKSKKRERSWIEAAEICVILFVAIYSVLNIGLSAGLIPAWVSGPFFGSPMVVYLIGLSILLWLFITDNRSYSTIWGLMRVFGARNPKTFQPTQDKKSPHMPSFLPAKPDRMTENGKGRSLTIEESLITEQMKVQQWTAQQFERQVLDGKPKVAVFDCDGTLWGGDAGNGFMVWSIEQGLVSREATDWINTRYRNYLAGQVSEVEICGEMVRMYAGLHDDALRSAAARYVREFVQPRIFAEMADLLAKLNQAGVQLWAVSSTNKWVVAEGVRAFNIPEERVVAAEVRIANGLITSELVGVPTGEGKAEALQRIGLVRPDAVFGNSIHDLAMLELARRAYPVNPSPSLITAAARHGWGCFRPAAAEDAEAAVAGE